jgi:hypothetical protein
MSRKDDLERYNKLKTQLDKLKKAEQDLDKKMKFLSKDDARKKRAHRLIQTGALVETYFETKHLSIEEVEELLKMFSSYVNQNKPKKFKK